MKYVFFTLLGLVLLHNVCLADDKLELRDDNDKISYSIGYQVGTDLKTHGVKPNAAALVRGVEDATASGKTLLTPEEMQTLLVDLKKKIDARQVQENRQAAEKYRGEGRAFLVENAKKKGVISLPSGLQYLVLKEGTGRTPKAGDTVTANYRGTLLDGREFDSSFRDQKPATFRLDAVIPGWREALLLMKEGAKWKLFIPSDLAFGERGPLADKVVIYELELLSVQPAGEKPSPAENTAR